MKNVLNGFKNFVLRGNAIDLAVGIVIGTAFTLVVTSIVTGLINPLVAAIFGQKDLSKVGNFTINGADFSVGLVLDSVFKFLCVAAALYFLIVLPMNHLAARRKKGVEDEPKAPAEDVLVLQEIRDLLAAQNARGAGPAGPVTGTGPAGGPTDGPGGR